MNYVTFFIKLLKFKNQKKKKKEKNFMLLFLSINKQLKKNV